MKDVVLQELSSPGCHNCQAFIEFWHSIEKDWPNVKFQDIGLMTPEGQEMVQKYQIMASPGIILNGELFSTGGVDKDKFVAKLQEISKE
tara:strand:+ start:270 stop:536 length:267 start_codon:yes stop_codon:yes gene_type:complete